MNLRKFFNVPVGLALAVTLFSAGCGGDTTNKDLPDGFTGPPAVTPPTTATSVTFDPSSTSLQLKLPLPNDLARNPQTGFNAIPGTGEPVDAMNSIQGFSTSGLIFVPFTANIDPATIDNNSIQVFDAVTRVQAPMTMSIAVGDVGSQSLVLLLPVRPLNPARPYVVVVNSSVRDTLGRPITSSYPELALKSTTPLVDGNGTSVFPFLNDAQAGALEPVRAAYQPIWQAAESATGQSRESIPFAFGFTTQPLFQALTTIRARTQTENPTPTLIPGQQFVGPVAITAFLNATPTGQAILAGQPLFPAVVGSIRFGTFPATQYQPNVDTADAGFFQGTPDNPTPQGVKDIQFIVATPASPPAGPGPYPTIIFQHGVTRSKEDMLAVTFAACAQGFAVIGIDMVDHGSQNIPGANPPGTNGAGFFNPANLRVTRDNFRQTVVDQMTLARMITSGATDFDGNAVPDLAPNPPVKPPFVGTSFGAFCGTMFAAVDASIDSAVLNVAGARYSTAVQNSGAFGPPILAGLQAQGLEPGTISFNQFFWIAQTVLDDADPINYAPHLFSGDLKGNSATKVLVQEMLDDTVVPNSATTDLVLAMGTNQVNAKRVVSVTPPGLPAVSLNQVTAAQPIVLPAPIGPTLAFDGNGLFQEEGGGHGYLLDPSQGGPGGALTVHGQFQAGSFVALHFIVPNLYPIIQKATEEAPQGLKIEWDFSRAFKGVN